MQSQSSTVDDSGFFGHPKGLAVLFNAELWERFSFYGMRALLTLYMVKHFGFDKPHAYAIYGAYAALVYACPVVGGWLANRFLGYSRAVILGGVLMAFGHFAMAFPGEVMFFTALALLCVGNGFFKPNISSTVGRLYQDGDPRKERGFYIFYMGINIGALLAPNLCGALGEKVGWHYGFGLAGIGMLVGLVYYVRGLKHIGEHGAAPDLPALLAPRLLGLNTQHWIIAGSLLAVPLMALCLWKYEIAGWIIQFVSAAVVVILVVIALRQEGAARMKMFALMALMGFHMLFWAAFEQAGSSLSILTDEHVNRVVGGVEVSASQFQSINPIFIIVLVPAFTILWRKLAEKNANPSVPVKFGLALAQVGLGFQILNVGIEATGGTGLIPLYFLVLCYLLHTTGELCLSPVGLSAVTNLMPKRWVGFGMGAWFLTIANAHLLAGAIAKMTAGGDSGEQVTGAAALAQYQEVFGQVSYLVIGAAVVLLLVSPIIKRMMGDAAVTARG